MNEEQARERIAELRGYYRHLATYVAVNGFLLAINLMTGTDTLWFLFPLLGWGIAIVIQSFNVLWTGQGWETRKLEELTGLKSTRDEVARLAERTETLTRILSSVNWERIDPELLATRDSLEAAQGRIAALERRDDPASQEQLAREIEKLEAFVTSPRFSYYEMAAEEQRRN